MLPYILAAVGGYLIGQSQKKETFADGGMIWASPTLRKKYEFAFGKDFKPEYAIESSKKESLIESYYWNYLLDVLEIEELDEKAANDWKVAREVEDGKLVQKGPYRTRYMYSPSLDRLREQNEGEWYLYGSVSDTFAKGGMAKGGNIPEKEVEGLKRYTLKWYGKDGMDDDDDADFKPPVTQKEVEDAVSEYVRFCKKAMSEGNESKWGGGDSFDREVVADIMQYNRNPEADTFFYPELIKEIKNIDGKMPMMYAKGGKTKSKKWIQDALGGDEGSLRRTAKRKGLLKGDENLSMTDLKKLQKMGGKTAKRAHLAETLRKFDDGGTMN